jgi:hypothetical protein
MGLWSDCSSTGELAFELACNAVVKSDCCRSQRGFDLVNEVVEEYSSFKVAGREVRPCSGGSSTSAMTSSSDVMAGGAVLGIFGVLPASSAPRLPTCSWSFAMVNVLIAMCKSQKVVLSALQIQIQVRVRD